MFLFDWKKQNVIMTMFICNKQCIDVNDNFSFGNGNFSIFFSVVVLGFDAIKKVVQEI